VATKWFGIAIPVLLIIYFFMQRWGRCTVDVVLCIRFPLHAIRLRVWGRIWYGSISCRSMWS
jgi:hypothetical protein